MGAGDEDLLRYFESHCLGTLANQQVTWKHPKLSVVHSVRLEACFTRFRVEQLQTNVKVLSSGRPIRPVGTFQPLLYIYVTSNNISHYTSHGGRSAIGSWLGHLRARNVFDWLIVMVNSDPQYNTPKILQKSNVLDKIKSDFSVRTGDRQFLEVPAPNSVEERLFNESWNQLTYLIRKAIISACMSVIVDYDEELAHLYLFLGGHEHALQEYREASELLSHCIQASVDHESKRPQWLNRLVQLSSSSDDASHYICDYSFDVTNTEIKQSSRLKDHDATLFELKNYLLSRQASILCICDRLEEFPLYTYHTICSTLAEINILDIQTEHIFRAVWILCICLNTLTSMRLDSDRSKDDVNKSIIELLDTAFSCNNILENINFTRISVGSFSRSSSLSPSSTHLAPPTPSSNTTQCVFIDANKDSNRTIWYMSHLVDKIFTDFHCHHHYHPHHQVLRKLSHDAFWTESYAVELWLLVFDNLKQIGQLIGLWCVKSNLPIHRENHSLLNKTLATGVLIQSIDYFGEGISEYKNNPKSERQQQLPNVELEMAYEEVEASLRDNALLYAHNHLIPLFTSSMIYSQVFTATGQILVGFLKLMHNPKRAYEIVCDLGDFLFSQGAYESASWLYESVINYYDESSWISLVTSTRLCLAWCLHSLCIKKHFETKNDCEIARKYIQTCFTLAGTKQSILRSAADHVYGKIYFWYQTIDCIQVLSIPHYGDAINPNYWWQEAIEFRNSLLTYHQYIVLDPYNMLPLFSLKSIELEGVCNCGYQLIFAELESNSERTFKASVYITGSKPSYTDWQTLLNPNEFLPYHIMDKVNQSLVSQSDSQLHLISLTNQPSISVVKNHTTGPNIDNSTNMTKLYSVCPTRRRSRLSFSFNGRQSLFETENMYSSSSTTTTVSAKSPLFILHQKESFVLIKPGLNRFSFIANVSPFVFILF
ncbi:Trafficking protein particle complex subunit 10 [Schistosoma japonicum]|nr:Trafficking protein particle complex subunit 10 [Schistosoma japonicum]